MKTLKEYREFVESVWEKPKAGDTLTVAALGLGGESGEVLDEIKKGYHSEGEITGKRKNKLLFELGDALFYITKIAVELGWTLEEVAGANQTKLLNRKANGTLGHESR